MAARLVGDPQTAIDYSQWTMFNPVRWLARTES